MRSTTCTSQAPTPRQREKPALPERRGAVGGRCRASVCRTRRTEAEDERAVLASRRQAREAVAAVATVATTATAACASAWIRAAADGRSVARAGGGARGALLCGVLFHASVRTHLASCRAARREPTARVAPGSPGPTLGCRSLRRDSAAMGHRRRWQKNAAPESEAGPLVGGSALLALGRPAANGAHAGVPATVWTSAFGVAHGAVGLRGLDASRMRASSHRRRRC